MQIGGSHSVAKTGLIFGLALTLAACGGGDGDPSTTTPPAVEAPTSSSTSPAVEEPTTAEPTPEETATPEFSVGGNAGAVPGESANDGLGQYTQMTLSPDSALLKFDDIESVGEGVTERFSAAELSEAQQFIARYIVEELLDSTVAFDNVDPAGSREAWLTENLATYTTSNWRDEAAEYVRSTRNSLVIGTDAPTESGDVSAVRGSAVYGGMRYTAVDAKIQSIYLNSADELGFEFSVYTTAPVRHPTSVDDTAVYEEHQRTYQDFVVGLEEGAWKITGHTYGFNRAVKDEGQSEEAMWEELLATGDQSERMESWEDPRN